GLALVLIEWVGRRLQLIGASSKRDVIEHAEIAQPEPEPEVASPLEPLTDVAAPSVVDPQLVSESTSPLKAVRPNTETTPTIAAAVEADLVPVFEPNIAPDAPRPVPAKKAPSRKPRSTNTRASARSLAKTAGTRTHNAP